MWKKENDEVRLGNFEVDEKVLFWYFLKNHNYEIQNIFKRPKIMLKLFQWWLPQFMKIYGH